MTQEEKAKAYDKALEIARQYYEKDSMNAFLDTIFPELAESEDERIRKRLIEYFEGFRMGNAEVKWEGLNVQEVLVWLEKQKEQKPAEWSEEDEEILKLLILNIGRYMYFGGMSSERILSFLKSLRPQQRQEWSEEEKEILDSILSHYVLIDKPIDANGISKEKYISLIKSIRFDTYKNCNSHWKPSEQEKGALRTAIHILTDERNFPKAAAQLQNILNAFEGEESRKDWKPSEEQMEALKWLIEYVAPSEKYIVLIKNLCDDLKKRM